MQLCEPTCGVSASDVLAVDTLLFWDSCTVQAGPRMHRDVPGPPTSMLMQTWSTDGPMLAVERGQDEAQMRCMSVGGRLCETIYQ